MTLPVRDRFESFTTSQRKVDDIADEFGVGVGNVGLIVASEVPIDDRLISMMDARASRRPEVLKYLRSLADWFWQDEVIVARSAPLPLVACYRYGLALNQTRDDDDVISAYPRL